MKSIKKKKKEKKKKEREEYKEYGIIIQHTKQKGFGTT